MHLSTSDRARIYGCATLAANFRQEVGHRLLDLMRDELISQAAVEYVLKDSLAQVDKFTLFWLQSAGLFVSCWEDATGLEHPCLVVSFEDAESAMHFASLVEPTEAIARTAHAIFGIEHLSICGDSLYLHATWRDGTLVILGEPSC